jgi:DNA-binding response OmpR family regulator
MSPNKVWFRADSQDVDQARRDDNTRMVPGKRILVIDDDASIAGLVAEALQEEGFRVASASDAIQARASAATQAPDLVLLDVNLPGLGGWELLDSLRPPGALTMPIIVMTGDSRALDGLDDARQRGIVNHLFKPFELNELLSKVRAALEAADAGE